MMKVAPDSEIRLANSEAASLALDADAAPDSVRLKPKFGDESTVPLEGGAFDFPALQAPNFVTVEWMAEGSVLFTSYVNLVSRHYFSLDALKAYGNGQDDFQDMPEEDLFQARQAATEVFELNAMRSFVHQVGRTKDYGRDSLLSLDHGDVYELLTEGYMQVNGGQVIRVPGAPQPFPRFVEYLYGKDSMPAEVSAAVLTLAAYTLRPSNRPIGATGESSDAGYIHFTIAGRDGATSIPEVNAAIEQFGRGGQCVW